MFIRSAYNYDRDAVSFATGLECLDESLALQSEKDSSDINVIVRNFGVTGTMQVAASLPEYGDFTGVDDYHSALGRLQAADEMFMRLPAALRDRFGHDPASLIGFLNDESNYDEAVSLGLLPERKKVVSKEVAPQDSAELDIP